MRASIKIELPACPSVCLPVCLPAHVANYVCLLTRRPFWPGGKNLAEGSQSCPQSAGGTRYRELHTTYNMHTYLCEIKMCYIRMFN